MSLTTNQEIRARALDIAAKMVVSPEFQIVKEGEWTRPDKNDVLSLADLFVDYIHGR